MTQTQQIIPLTGSFELAKRLLPLDHQKKWSIVERAAFYYVCKDVKIRKNASQKVINANTRIINTGMEKVFRSLLPYFKTHDVEFFNTISLKLPTWSGK